jgi:hypothetical protein
MPDITKCEGTICPLKNKCYRFRAKDSPEFQWYFAEVPFLMQKHGCDEFLDITNFLEELLNPIDEKDML